MDLVILDELGYLPFSQAGGALLFHLLSRLYEHTSVMIATNLWTSPNGRACSATPRCPPHCSIDLRITATSWRRATSRIASCIAVPWQRRGSRSVSRPASVPSRRSQLDSLSPAPSHRQSSSGRPGRGDQTTRHRVDFSTVDRHTVDTSPRVRIQSAGWVRFESARTFRTCEDQKERDTVREGTCPAEGPSLHRHGERERSFGGQRGAPN